MVGVANRDVSTYPSSVTVDGVPLTMDGSKVNTQTASIWSAVIPTGTTGTIVVTYAGTQTYCGIGIWETNGSPVNTATNGSNTANPACALTTAAGDFCIGVLAYRVSVSGDNFAWNTATERYDGPVDGAVRQHSGADTFATLTTTDMGGSITNYGAEASLVSVGYRA